MVLTPRNAGKPVRGCSSPMSGTPSCAKWALPGWQVEAGGPPCSDLPSCCPQSKVNCTFTGDAVRHQLIAHKARADDLPFCVPALLFARPAACNRGKQELEAKRIPLTFGFSSSVWTRPEEMSSGWMDRERQAPRLEPTAASTEPLPSHRRPWGLALVTPRGCSFRSQPWSDKLGSTPGSRTLSAVMELEGARQTRV